MPIEVRFSNRDLVDPWVYVYRQEEKFWLDLPVLNKEALWRNATLQVRKDFEGPLLVQNISGQVHCLTKTFYWYEI